MATEIKSFASRRTRDLAVLAISSALLIAVDFVATSAMRRTATFSGWSLLMLVIGLMLYNLRKRLPFLPLGNSATSMQIHTYVGLFSGVVFGIHIGWRIPTGVFEQVLAAIFVTVFLSGIVGITISRVFARRLGNRGTDVLFNRIPRLRNHLRERVERVVTTSLATTGSTAIPEFYSQRLKPFFERPRNFLQHLFLEDRPLRELLNELHSQQRYLSETEIEALQEIEEYVKQKNELDLHFAHQATLKYWLFLHVPLSYALLACIALHLLLIHTFVEIVR